MCYLHFHNNFHFLDHNNKLLEDMIVVENKVNTDDKVVPRKISQVNTFVQVFHNHHDILLHNIHLHHNFEILQCTVDDI